MAVAGDQIVGYTGMAMETKIAYHKERIVRLMETPATTSDLLSIEGGVFGGFPVVFVRKADTDLYDLYGELDV